MMKDKKSGPPMCGICKNVCCSSPALVSSAVIELRNYFLSESKFKSLIFPVRGTCALLGQTRGVQVGLSNKPKLYCYRNFH